MILITGNQDLNLPKELTLDTLETFSNVMLGETKDRIAALIYIGKVFQSLMQKNLMN